MLHTKKRINLTLRVMVAAVQSTSGCTQTSPRVAGRIGDADPIWLDDARNVFFGVFGLGDPDSSAQ
jgi:hypothetical protein